MHTKYLSYPLPLVDRVVANGTVFIYAIRRQIRSQSDLICLGVLFIEQVEVCVAENEVQREVE